MGLMKIRIHFHIKCLFGSKNYKLSHFQIFTLSTWHADHMWHHFVIRSIGIIWVARGPNALPIIFLPMNSSVSQESVCLRWEWGKGHMYIKHCFKRIFSVLLNWLLFKLKFLIPMVDFWVPSIISKVMPMIISLHVSSSSADSVAGLQC
jgi:hypothetical protein